MTFLPIVGRELRVTARRRGTYWNRVGVALVGLLVGGFIMLFPHVRSPQVLGIVLFYALAVISFIYSGFAGALTTADCVSEEKREGTLGLLFLTDLKGYDIVFGKLAATSLNVFYAILAIFPVMAIPLLVGGVSGAEFWRVVLVCLNNLFFSLAVGMLASAISRDERKAMLLAFLAILFFAFGLPLLGALHADSVRPSKPSPLFFIPSPGYACFMAFDETFKNLGQFNFFYASVLCIHGMSWLLLFLACFIVPRTWHDRAPSATAIRRRQVWQRLAHGSPEARAALRRRLLAVNPFYWLTGRDRFKMVLVWTTLAAGGLIWIWGIQYYRNSFLSEPAYVFTAITAHCVLKFWLASEACRRLAADRRSGALELLLATPLPVRDILRGQLLALLKQFGGPVLVVLIADGIFALTNRHDTDWMLVWLAGVTAFIADLITLSWLGMWMALRNRNLNRALGATLVRVLVLPWVIWLAVIIGVGTTMVFRRSTAMPSWFEHLPTLFWLFLALAVDGVFGLHARQRLRARFRVAATQRFEARKGAAE